MSPAGFIAVVVAVFLASYPTQEALFYHYL